MCYVNVSRAIERCASSSSSYLLSFATKTRRPRFAFTRGWHSRPPPTVPLAPKPTLQPPPPPQTLSLRIGRMAESSVRLWCEHSPFAFRLKLAFGFIFPVVLAAGSKKNSQEERKLPGRRENDELIDRLTESTKKSSSGSTVTTSEPLGSAKPTPAAALLPTSSSSSSLQSTVPQKAPLMTRPVLLPPPKQPANANAPAPKLPITANYSHRRLTGARKASLREHEELVTSGCVPRDNNDAVDAGQPAGTYETPPIITSTPNEPRHRAHRFRFPLSGASVVVRNNNNNNLNNNNFVNNVNNVNNSNKLSSELLQKARERQQRQQQENLYASFNSVATQSVQDTTLQSDDDDTDNNNLYNTASEGASSETDGNAPAPAPVQQVSFRPARPRPSPHPISELQNDANESWNSVATAEQQQDEGFSAIVDEEPDLTQRDMTGNATPFQTATEDGWNNADPNAVDVDNVTLQNESWNSIATAEETSPASQEEYCDQAVENEEESQGDVVAESYDEQFNSAFENGAENEDQGWGDADDANQDDDVDDDGWNSIDNDGDGGNVWEGNSSRASQETKIFNGKDDDGEGEAFDSALASSEEYPDETGQGDDNQLYDTAVEVESEETDQGWGDNNVDNYAEEQHVAADENEDAAGWGDDNAEVNQNADENVDEWGCDDAETNQDGENVDGQGCDNAETNQDENAADNGEGWGDYDAHADQDGQDAVDNADGWAGDNAESNQVADQNDNGWADDNVDDTQEEDAENEETENDNANDNANEDSAAWTTATDSSAIESAQASNVWATIGSGGDESRSANQLSNKGVGDRKASQDVEDIYCDDELNPDDPHLQLQQMPGQELEGEEGGEGVRGRYPPHPMLVDQESILSMDIPSTGPTSLRSNYTDDTDEGDFETGEKDRTAFVTRPTTEELSSATLIA